MSFGRYLVVGKVSARKILAATSAAKQASFCYNKIMNPQEENKLALPPETTATGWIISTPEDIVDLVTGILTNSKAANFASGARIVKNFIRGKGFNSFLEELRNLKRQGEIKSEFNEGEVDDQLFDLLNILDSEDVDSKKRLAAQKIFFKTVHPNVTNDEQILSHQLLRILSKLTSLDLMILQACYEITNGQIKPSVKINKERPTSYIDWAQVFVTQAGLHLRSFEESADQKLVDMRLLSHRTYSDLSGVNLDDNYRLTDLGYKLCEWIF